MSEDLHGVYAHGIEGIAEELRQECIDETREAGRKLGLALEAARHERITQQELKDEFSRAALELRVQAANVGVRIIGTVAMRLEDYLSNLGPELPPRAFDDLQVFLDLFDDLTEGRLPLDSDAAAVVRRLPARIGFSASDIEVRNIEVLLVMLHGTATHYVERELQQCGYRVAKVTTVFEAFPLIVRTKPDFVIISAIMPELDGIDLAIGLTSMPATRNIPIALITSMEDSDEHLSLLPKKVPVIHKGPSFGDDLFKALDAQFLI